jgi:integrase
LAEWLGPDRLFKDITRPDLNRLLNMLQIEKGYSASSVRNFMTVLTTLYKHAAKRWGLPMENRASGLDLPKVQNAIQRYWTGNEKERLFASIDKTSPWLRPIVELSLAMAFRRGELVQSAQRKKGKDGQLVDTDGQSGGLRWEYIDWDNKTIQLPNEKNDHTKKNTEYRGRTVPLTTEVSRILLPLYKASETKRGLVFSATTNSVTQAFANCCKKAEPPIEGLTFHSLRKIATKDLSRLVKTPMELSRITGHKNIEVMNQRYFSVSPQDLLAQLDGSSGSLRHRALTSLTAQFGQEQTRRFLEEVRQAESVQAFIEGANAEQANSSD